MDKQQSILQQIRQSAPAQAVDVAIKKIDKFLGPSGKAFMANGLDELAQVFTPGTEQIQPGNNPGLWGRPTTGEATMERTGKFSPDDLRSSAAARDAQEPDQARRERQEPEKGREPERGIE